VTGGEPEKPRRSGAFSSLPGGRALHPAFQLLPVQLSVAVVVDRVELGGQRGVRPRLAAADAAVAVAVHGGEVDLVVADDRVRRTGSEGHQRLGGSGGHDAGRRRRSRRGGDRVLRRLRGERGFGGGKRGLRAGVAGGIGGLAGLERRVLGPAGPAGRGRTRRAGLVGRAGGAACGFFGLHRGLAGDVGLVLGIRRAIAGHGATALAGGSLRGGVAGRLRLGAGHVGFGRGGARCVLRGFLGGAQLDGGLCPCAARGERTDQGDGKQGRGGGT